MTRIKYTKIGEYVFSKNNFSTRTHEELQYVAIHLESFTYFLVNASVSRHPDRLKYYIPDIAYAAASLTEAKKNVKKLLLNSGVSFNVEARNKKKKIKTQETESQVSLNDSAL